jgi:hypothetical protein
MTWTLLLSEYPRAVLKDDVAISILALLERHGALTEEELLPHVENRLELANRLLALHRNQLIETTPEIIRLTLRGKQLLDRLSLQADIIEDVVASLDLAEEEREAYRRQLAAYRELAFAHYLDSLSSVHAWDVFYGKLLSYRKTDVPIESQHIDKQFGRLVVLLRSLENWLTHYPESKRPYFSADAGADIVLESAQKKTFVQFKHLGARSARAQTCLLFAESRGPDYWLKSYGESDVNDSLAVFLSSQKARPKSEWLTGWTYARRASEKGEHVIEALRRILAESSVAEGGQLAADRLALDRADFFGATQEATTIISALLASSSIEQFATLTGQSLEGSRSMLEMIRANCNRLLDAHDPLPNVP